MEKTFPKLFIVLLLSVSLAGCGNADIEGIVLELNENGMKIATELSPKEYEEIKDVPVSDIQNEDVNGDTYRGLIDLTYDNTDNFDKGDEVEVWIDGDIRESYPLGAKAKKVSKKE